MFLSGLLKYHSTTALTTPSTHQHHGPPCRLVLFHIVPVFHSCYLGHL